MSFDGITDQEVETNTYLFDSALNQIGAGGEYYIGPGTYYLVHRITLSEPIAKGEIFDVSARMHIYVDEIVESTTIVQSEWRFRTYDVNWNSVNNWISTNSTHAKHMTRKEANSNEMRYTITDIAADAPITHIQIYQKIVVSGQYMTIEHDVHTINITPVSEAGAVSSILEYIKNLPTNIKNSLKSLFDGITNAISNAVNSILEGIKTLFVPTESDITAYKDKWDQLLQQRFGALYQCVSLVQSYWQSIRPGAAKGSIEFPIVQLYFGEVPWEFGGWTVQIVPAGFEYPVQVLRLIVNAVSTMAVLNALKKRYERLIET